MNSNNTEEFLEFVKSHKAGLYISHYYLSIVRLKLIDNLNYVQLGTKFNRTSSNMRSIFLKGYNRLHEVFPIAKNGIHFTKDTKILYIPISIRIRNCLCNMDIETISDLLNKPSKEILKARNMGLRSFEELDDFLRRNNFKFEDGSLINNKQNKNIEKYKRYIESSKFTIIEIQNKISKYENIIKLLEEKK